MRYPESPPLFPMISACLLNYSICCPANSFWSYRCYTIPVIQCPIRKVGFACSTFPERLKPEAKSSFLIALPHYQVSGILNIGPHFAFHRQKWCFSKRNHKTLKDKDYLRRLHQFIGTNHCLYLPS